MEPYINRALILEETEPLNSNFDSLGFSSMYFTNNLGTLLLAFLFYFVSVFFCWLLSFWVPNRPRVARVYENLRASLFYNSFVSMMTESYAVMAVCVMINLEYIVWDSWGKSVQSAICLLALSLLVLFPVVLSIVSKTSWERDFKHLKERIEPFFEDLNLKNGPIVMLQPVYFLLRRFLMAYIVVFYREHLFFQILFKALSIVAGVILVGHVDALYPQKRSIEFLNECIIMCVLYSMICFSPLVPDPYARYELGFFCIVIVGVHLAINLFLILFNNFKKVKLDLMIWIARRALKKQSANQKALLDSTRVRRHMLRRQLLKKARA